VDTPKSGYCLVRFIAVNLENHMIRYSPEAPGAIQARLTYLRLRKAALDELILSLERYLVYQLPTPKKVQSAPQTRVGVSRLAGAA
jgi:hypothetical protein